MHIMFVLSLSLFPLSKDVVVPPTDETSVRITLLKPAKTAQTVPTETPVRQVPEKNTEEKSVIPQIEDIETESQELEQPEVVERQEASDLSIEGSETTFSTESKVESVASNQDTAPESKVSPTQMTLILAELNERLQQEHSYPRMARRRGWEGQVVVFVRLDSKGFHEELRIQQSSGRDILDEAALKLVEGVLPVETPLNQSVSLEIPITYRLN